jgi:hypothetical protein
MNALETSDMVRVACPKCGAQLELPFRHRSLVHCACGNSYKLDMYPDAQGNPTLQRLSGYKDKGDGNYSASLEETISLEWGMLL